MTKSWEKIREYYIELASAPNLKTEPSIAGMVNLVKAIEQSRYASGLHAWTSMHDLCIAQTPVDYPYNGPFLRISPQFGNGKLDFLYVDTHIKNQQWHRVVDHDQGFSRLERFMDQLHWVTNAQ